VEWGGGFAVGQTHLVMKKVARGATSLRERFRHTGGIAARMKNRRNVAAKTSENMPFFQ